MHVCVSHTYVCTLRLIPCRSVCGKYVRTYMDTKYICTHLFHFIEGCHLNLGNVGQVGCLDQFIECLIGCQPHALVLKAAHGKEHAQCVHEVLGVALLRSAAVGRVNRTMTSSLWLCV